MTMGDHTNLASVMSHHGPGRYSAAHAGTASHDGSEPLPRATGTWIVDTNVILVANGQHDQVDAASQARCAQWLQAIMLEGRVALDDAHAILGEYQHKTHASDGTGVGDVFLRWLLHEQDNPARVDKLPLPMVGGHHVHFPSDIRLDQFDLSDRKFVALAVAHPEHPVILQATDSKWLDWAPALRDHQIEVRFICQAVIAAFHEHKHDH